MVLSVRLAAWIAVFLAGHLPAAGQSLPLTGPPIALTPVPGEAWRETIRSDGYQTWVRLKAADGTPMVFTLSCLQGRGTVFLQRDAQPQDTLRITMVVRAGGRQVLQEEAELYAAGYTTRWVEPADFLAAMGALRGQSEIELDMQGGTRRTQFNLRLPDAHGFRRAAERCPAVMR